MHLFERSEGQEEEAEGALGVRKAAAWGGTKGGVGPDIKEGWRKRVPAKPGVGRPKRRCHTKLGLERTFQLEISLGVTCSIR